MTENPQTPGPDDAASSFGTPPSYGTPPPGQGFQPPPPPPGYATPAPAAPLSQADEKQWAMFAHLGGIIGILPSLIIYLVFKDRGPFVKDQSQEALNFQITALIGYIVLYVAWVAFLPIPLNYILWIVVAVFSIIGGMAANRGEAYRYPYALRLVK